MKLIVYKGFDTRFLKNISYSPLFDNSIEEKMCFLNFDKSYKKALRVALNSLDEDESVWMTYDEYSLVKKTVDGLIDEENLDVLIIVNNIYPDYYPLSCNISAELVSEVERVKESEGNVECSEACQLFLDVYNSVVQIDDTYYVGYYNYEQNQDVKIEKYYNTDISIKDASETQDYILYTNGDIDTYLRDFNRIQRIKPQSIGIKLIENNNITNVIVNSLYTYCSLNNIELSYAFESIEEDSEIDNDLYDIAKNALNIDGFKDFRKLKLYKNPDVSNEVIDVSQGTIIKDIIRQAEKAYSDSNTVTYRDVFITAPTGAGKSVMFLVPAIYLARKYHKLTIIIEPVKALMQDQKQKLIDCGYGRVEAFNSDLITQNEKEKVLSRIKNGEIDLLYLSPETLLSYSIETIVGDREIGLLIVDEAHIVTTWGVGFRPDYWYLGGYINKLRNNVNYTKNRNRKTYKFPLCAFTATAINGGLDDSVSDTIVSLYMENPILYLGCVKREDISFEINNVCDKKLAKSDYLKWKNKLFNSRVIEWLNSGEKTIVYFPYAKYAQNAHKGYESFAGMVVDPRIGIYTGRNVEEMSNEAFNYSKKETFEKFRTGEKNVIYATKAFGLGVDVNDVKNVYHYAVSGTLFDYVQEIGRAARKVGMNGRAIIDHFNSDNIFTNQLFGMSQIRHYQIMRVLDGIYQTYKSKNGSRNFLISPQSFTYLFSGKDDNAKINKLKTCLLMLEKDLYEKYTFKVLISRSQSVFTKAYVVIDKEYENQVLNSVYGKYFKFVCKGRENKQEYNHVVSDFGDIYSIDLKSIWENYHPDMSFPYFKYLYFNSKTKEANRIMPSIRKYIFARQKVMIQSRKGIKLSDVRERIVSDIEYVTDNLCQYYNRKYFDDNDFLKVISDRFGKEQSRIIVNSFFDLVDPERKCVKLKSEEYYISDGRLKTLALKIIKNNNLMNHLSQTDGETYSDYISTASEASDKTLKLLSLFGYINYEITGGEEPEIFIRLNDPDKIKGIIFANIFYKNSYVIKARQKHNRDVDVINTFFDKLNSDEQRWDYIERYFLGYDVLSEYMNTPDVHITDDYIAVNKSRGISTLEINLERSYQIPEGSSWDDIALYFDESNVKVIDMFKSNNIPIPTHLKTVFRNSEYGNGILFSWANHQVAICSDEKDYSEITEMQQANWDVFKVSEIHPELLMEVFE